MLKNFDNPFFKLTNNLPIILHSNDASKPCNLLMRDAGNYEKIQEKIKE